MNWEEEGGPAEGRVRREGAEWYLERLSKERSVLQEAWDQMYSRLGIILGPARPTPGAVAEDATKEKSELCSRLENEAFQMSRLAYGIRETMERLEI